MVLKQYHVEVNKSRGGFFMEYTLTLATWFWFLVPMPLMVVWAVWTYVKETGGDKS